jgi:hypothetical protein
MQILESLRPYEGAFLAALVAVAVAAAARRLGRPLLGAAAAGIGVLAGWWFTFGLLTASPRQLPERLPLLMLGLVLLAPLLGLPVRRWRRLGLPAAALGALWVGWWMAGGPLHLPDVQRAAIAFGGIALATLLLAGAAAPRWAAPVSAAALLAGLHGAGLRGPQFLLGTSLLAASAAAALVPAGRGGGAHPALAALPIAGGIAALAAVPLLARGATADWLAAAAPLVALLAGAPLGARLHRRHGAAVGAAVAGGAVALAVRFFA